jgi:hypothetical protein
MRFKFTGKYTNGHTSVVIHGVRFDGFDPTNVEDEAAASRLKTHPEVAVVAGRPPKAGKED